MRLLGRRSTVNIYLRDYLNLIPQTNFSKKKKCYYFNNSQYSAIVRKEGLANLIFIRHIEETRNIGKHWVTYLTSLCKRLTEQEVEVILSGKCFLFRIRFRFLLKSTSNLRLNSEIIFPIYFFPLNWCRWVHLHGGLIHTPPRFFNTSRGLYFVSYLEFGFRFHLKKCLFSFILSSPLHIIGITVLLGVNWFKKKKKQEHRPKKDRKLRRTTFAHILNGHIKEK